MQHSISSLLGEGGASIGSSSSYRADDDRRRSKNFSIDFLLSTTRRPSSRTSLPLAAETSELPVSSKDVAGDLQGTSQNPRPHQSDTPGSFQNSETHKRTKLANCLTSESYLSMFQLPQQAYLQFLEFHEKSKRLQRLHAITTGANSLPVRHFRSSADDSGVPSIADVERLRMIGREIRCCFSSHTTNGFRYESDGGQLSELQLRQQAMTSLFGCGVGNIVHSGHHNGSPTCWPGASVLPSPHGPTWPGPHATSAASDDTVGCWTSTRSAPPPFGLLRHRRKRIRTAFSALQMSRLESAFHHNKYLVGGDRRMLAFQLGLSETQVKVWFQNRRTKQKRSQWDCDVSDGHSPNIGSRLAYSSLSSPPSSASSPLTDEFHPRRDVITSADGKMTSSRGIVYSSPDELNPVT